MQYIVPILFQYYTEQIPYALEMLHLGGNIFLLKKNPGLR